MKSTRVIDCPDDNTTCTTVARSVDHDERVILPDGSPAPAGPANNQYTGIAGNQ